MWLIVVDQNSGPYLPAFKSVYIVSICVSTTFPNYHQFKNY